MSIFKKTCLGIFIISFLNTNSYSQTADSLDGGGQGQYGSALERIAINTQGILAKVNEMPSYIAAMVAFAIAWTKEDDSDTTANLQSSFANVATTSLGDIDSQLNLQQKLTQNFFGTTATKENLPNANDLTYQTLLGKPYFSPDPREEMQKNQANPVKIDPAYNYVFNTAGLGINHPIPSPNWQGSKQNQLKYLSYFNAINSIQTYDAYILSRMYAEFSNNNQLNTLQTQLIQQASDSKTWFAEVASENIGIVLRQILMYNSQMYIILTQMHQTMKQMLAAQAMSNTLIVLGNQYTESQLLDKATRPS